MKNLFTPVCLLVIIIAGSLNAQTITLTFQGTNAQTSNTVMLEGVHIKNLTLGCDTILYGPDPSIILNNLVGIGQQSAPGRGPLILFPPLPNPSSGSAVVSIYLGEESHLEMQLTTLRGQIAASFEGSMEAGLHHFEITMAGHDLFLLKASAGTVTQTIKVLNITREGQGNEIRHSVKEAMASEKAALNSLDTAFVFYAGNQLEYTAWAIGFQNETIQDAPDQDTDYTFEMDLMVESDGFYVFGPATAFPAVDPNGVMKATRNEITQTVREQLLEIYIPVLGGGGGFHVLEVNAGDVTMYGPGGEFGMVSPGEEEPQVNYQRGEFTETTDNFQVPVDAMYHVALDTEAGIIVIIPVYYWGMVGSATPGGWSIDSQMPPLAFDLDSMTFEITELPLTQHDWKFRYSGGWKAWLDPDFNVGGGVVGIRINTNFGGSADSLVPGGANIHNDVPGFYTVKLDYVVGQPYEATLTKTGDLPIFDYSDTELGLVGDGIIINGVQQNWDFTVMLHTPAVTNETHYTWSFPGVEITTEGAFKIREGQDWNNMIIGYPDVIMAGSSAELFTTDYDGNFVTLADGYYDMDLLIEAETETYTFTVSEAVYEPELYIVGDGTPAGWDNTDAIPMAGTGGYYTITLYLEGGGLIKFLETLGQWVPQYGTDEYGTSSGGSLVYRPDEATPDPPAIPAPSVAGSYIITANTNDLEYTIEPVK